MNQTSINEFFLCLSRMNVVNNDQKNRLLNQYYNNSYDRSSIHNHQLPVEGLFEEKSDSDENHNQDIHHDHDHNQDHIHDENSNDIVMAKAIAILVLFCATTVCGAIPFILNRYFKGDDNTNKNASDNARSAIIVKCLLYFGGGVLLCTTFLHLLPEVREAVESLQECGTFPKLTFPLVEVLMCAGFFLMFLIEELIHAFIHRNSNVLSEDTMAFERSRSIRHSYIMRSQKDENGSASDEFQNSKPISSQDVYSSDMENQKHQHNNHQRTIPAGFNEQDHSNAVSHHSHSHSHLYGDNHGHSHHHNHHSHLPNKNNSDNNIIASSLRGLLIVLALSVHELFEGLAIGLEGSASNVWFMFAAVSAHKLVLAFCVGVELIVARTKVFLSGLFVFTFAIVSPIGIGMGMVVSSHSNTATSIPSAILQGLACGTLLYVVFFEILSKERSGLLGYLAIILGFGVMFGLQQLVSGHHSHSHGCSPEDSHSHGHEHEHKLLLSDVQNHSMK